MVFTKWFATLGLTLIVFGLIDFNRIWADKIYFRTWVLPKNIYLTAGVMSIIFGLLLDLFVWFFFIKF